jgi:flavin reductase (DIM6/NTAB) family NADH-FMN oxidoreductase RutF
MEDASAKPAVSIDPRTFWRLVGQRPVGATIVTASGVDGPRGFLGLSATHLSADPPLMLVSIDKRTSGLASVLSARHFAINYLAVGSAALADVFAGKAGITGAARFEGAPWGALTTGAPIFLEAVASLDCSLEETIERNGMMIAIGRVVDFAVKPDAEPLICFRGGYLP